MIEFLESGELPEDEKDACKIASQASLFILIDDILYFLDLKHGAYKRIPVPQHLRQTILEESHGGCLTGHFQEHGYTTCLPEDGGGVVCILMWWSGMYSDVPSDL